MSPKPVVVSPSGGVPSLPLAVAVLITGAVACGPGTPTTPERVSQALKTTPGELPLGRVSVSNLTPTVGETVQVWAPYAGTWPAALDWEGVDENLGVRATVQPTAAGPLQLSVNSLEVSLNVQPASNTGTPALSSTAKRLPDLEHTCQDTRFPTLAGAFAVGCSSTGLVDTAIDLRTGQSLTLTGAVASPGVGVDTLHTPGHQRGIWKLPATQATAGSAAPQTRIDAPTATDGERAALLLDEHVTFFRPGEAQRRLPDARPVPWYAPAIAGDWMAWIDDREAQWTGRDLWLLGDDDQSFPLPLSRDASEPRHPAGRERWLGWIDDTHVWIEDMNTGERRGVEAQSGFRAGLGLWGPIGCWEERVTDRIDVACTDGLQAKDAGWPARHGPWLLYRRGDRVWLATADELILDDDDARATWTGTRLEGGYRDAHVDSTVTWTLDWPTQGWCARPWVAETGTWGSPQPLPPGENMLTHPGGDAMQLRPNCDDEGSVDG